MVLVYGVSCIYRRFPQGVTTFWCLSPLLVFKGRIINGSISLKAVVLVCLFCVACLHAVAACVHKGVIILNSKG